MYELSSLKPNAIDSYKRILAVLVDGKPKTWNQIYEKTNLSKGCFSQRFRELVESGHIEGKIVVNSEKKLIPVYKSINKPLLFCLGETKDVLRVYFEKNGKGIIKAEDRVKVRNPKAKKYYTRRVKRDV